MLAVIRHGDRTPKQKMKMKVTQDPLLALLQKYMDSKGKQAKLKVRGVFGWMGAGVGGNVVQVAQWWSGCPTLHLTPTS